jgi:hypothetical protein
VFDPRPVFGSQLSHANLLRLLELLALDTTEPGDPLSTGAVHVTNAVKCDKCARTGKTGRVAINSSIPSGVGARGGPAGGQRARSLSPIR